MSKEKFKKTALHSGIGDGQDMLVKQPSSEEAWEEFNIATRARGKKRNKANVYPQVDFQYGIHYKGKTVDTYHEQPFDLDIPAYPKRVLEYDIEERRYLCYERFWEIKAWFEAEVEKKTLRYAIEVEGTSTISDPMDYRLKWTVSIPKSGTKSFKDFIFDPQYSQKITQSENPPWRVEGGDVVDDYNSNYFSAMISSTSDIKGMTSFEANIVFQALYMPEKLMGAGATIRKAMSPVTDSPTEYIYKTAPGADDDLIGVIFKAKSRDEFYCWLIEGQRRMLPGTRSAELDGMTVNDSYIEFSKRKDPKNNIAVDETIPSNSETAFGKDMVYYGSGNAPGYYTANRRLWRAAKQQEWRNFVANQGWRDAHQRIYKYSGGRFHKVNASFIGGAGKSGFLLDKEDSQGNGTGRDHSVKIISKGKSVEILFDGNPAFRFETEWEEGDIGAMNVSQAVRFKKLDVARTDILTGYIPKDGWDTVEEGEKVVTNDIQSYILNHPDVKKAIQDSGNDPSKAKLIAASVETKDGGTGVVEVNYDSEGNPTGKLVVKAGTTTEPVSFRIPTNPTEWFTWDGFDGDNFVKTLEHTSQLEQFIKDNMGEVPEGFKVGTVTPIIDNPDAGTAYVQGESLFAESSNPPDAGKIYEATHYKCGFAEICPDNIDKETGITITNDVNILFSAEIEQFFNRSDYINKKKEFSLIYPVWTEQSTDIVNPGKEPVLSLGGCVIEPGEDPEYGDIIKCRPEIDDFFWDGSMLILWTCDPPVKYKTNSYSYGLYAFEGEIRRSHHEDFEMPNPWTTYRLIPIEETIEARYDYVKWVGTDLLEWLPPYTQVRLKTKRYFIPSWTGPYEGKNQGIVTSEETLYCEIPPIPEYYLDPETLTTMPHGYSGFIFMLESKNGFKLDTELELWWLSTPEVTTLNVNRNASNLNKLTGIPMMPALHMADKVVIYCHEKPKYTEWTSGKYMGYGKLNGKEPLRCDGAGKADMINVSTDVVYFPSNFVPESLQGPFIDVYADNDKYPGILIKWLLNKEKKIISFMTDYMADHEWLSDWKSNWVSYQHLYKIKSGDIVSLGNLNEFTLGSTAYDPASVIIEGIEVSTNNPYVLSWMKNNEDTQQTSPEIMAKVKDATPMRWSPMIHNGYYYSQNDEKYLYADKIVHTVTPSAQHEIIVSPRPEQGSAIIVEDNKGNNLRKVTFHDNNFNQTLMNEEIFSGNGNSAYYLGYKGIDKDTLTVEVNGQGVHYIFYEENSRIQFMHKYTKNDEIRVTYNVLYSYMIDMNYDIEGNKAKVTLHNNYKAENMSDMTVTYEAASETPFYYANNIKFNPLLNHNHTGFLFITEEAAAAQKVKDVKIFISPKTLEVKEMRKILITTKVIDEFGNPVVGKEVKLERNGMLQNTASFNNITNDAGEVYYYYTPITSPSDVPPTYFDEYKVVCENKSDIGTLNYYKKDNMNRRYIDIQTSKEAIIGGSSDEVNVGISLRDKNFRQIDGEVIKVEIISTDGVKVNSTHTIPSSKTVNLKIIGTGQKQGYVYIKVTHDMGSENAISMKSIKVLGG